MPKIYKHKLAALGDSISQGFQNSAIYRTDLSYPAFLAKSLDSSAEFSQPKFSVKGGIPVNLDFILKSLEHQYTTELNWKSYPIAIKDVYAIIRRTKKYWDNKALVLDNEESGPYHNQSIWGLTTNDSWMLTDTISKEYMEHNPVHYAVFNFLPDHALYTTARCVLNPSGNPKRENRTLVDNIQELADDGGIEHLIVNLGSNHIVGAVTKMRFQYSEPDEIEAHPFQRQYTVMRPEHFEQNYRKLASKIARMNIGQVTATTIPYITIPPVLQGINESAESPEREYFDYYANFWVDPNSFNPELHAHFTKNQAIDLDIAVDYFNEIIKKVAGENGWIVADVGRQVSMMAYRRHHGRLHLPYPTSLVKSLRSHGNTSYLVDDHGNVKLDTRYLKTNLETQQITEGGIFSLDGLHPTTVGYGIIAEMVKDAMSDAGVVFQQELDWDFIVENDSLIYTPPILLPELKSIYRLFSGVYNEARKISDPDKILEPLFGFYKSLVKTK